MAKSKYIIEFEKNIPQKNKDGKIEITVDDLMKIIGIFVTSDGRKFVIEHMQMDDDMRKIVDLSVQKDGIFPEDQYKKLKKQESVSFDIDGFRKKVGNFVRLLAIENSTILKALLEKGENKMVINLLNSGELFNIKLLVPVFKLAMQHKYLGIAQRLILMFIKKDKNEFAILGNKMVVETGISKSLMLGFFRKENFELFSKLLELENFQAGAKVDLNDHKEDVQEFISFLAENDKKLELKNMCSLISCKIDKKFTDKIGSKLLTKDLVDMLNKDATQEDDNKASKGVTKSKDSKKEKPAVKKEKKKKTAKKKK